MPVEYQPITKETSREALLNHQAMKLMTATDAVEFCDWTGVGTDKFDPSMTNYCLGAMTEKQQNLQTGLNRAGALLMARYYSLTGSWPGIELRKELYGELSGEVEDLDGIMREGFSEQDGVWRFTGKAETSLADKVTEVIDERVKTDRPEANLAELEEQIKDLKWKLGIEKEANGELLSKLDNAERELTEARAVKPATAEQVSWDQAAREKTRVFYEALPARKTPKGELKVRDQLDRALAALDPVTVKAENMNPPENLAETDNKLIAEFQQLPEVFIALGIQPEANMLAAVKTVFGELLKRNKLDSLVDFCTSLKTLPNAQEVVVALQDIMHFRLEERRKNQEQIYAQNRKRKEVRDYFAGHELKLVGERGIDEVLKQKFQMARDLGIDVLTQDQKITMPTELDEVTEVEVILDKVGAVIGTVLSVESFQGFDKKPLLWDELTTIVKAQTEITAFRLIKEYSGDEDQVGSFVVMFGEGRIGRIEFDKDRIGKLIVKWERPEATNLLDTSVYLINLLEKVEGEGSELKGLKLTAAAKGEAEKPEEKPKEEVKEAVASVTEMPSPAAGEPVVAAETPKELVEPVESVIKPRKAESESPDWLRALQEAPSRAAEQAPAESERPAAAPLSKPEMPKSKQKTGREGLDF